jgi:transposase
MVSPVHGDYRRCQAEIPLIDLFKFAEPALDRAISLWAAPGSEDTKLGVLWSRRCVMERRQFTREFKLEAVRLIKQRGVSYAQASKDLGIHPTQLRSWVKQLADDPQHAFPGHGQMKPEQLEIAQLKREVTKLKAERDILKKAAAYFAKEST